MAEPQMTTGSKFEHSRGRIDHALQKIWEHMDLWFHTRSRLDNATHKISEL